MHKVDLQGVSRGQACGVTTDTSSGDALIDNAMAESFFASLECELISRKIFKTRTEACLAVHLERRLLQPQATSWRLGTLTC